MRWARSRSPRIGSQAESKQQIATCICVGVRQLGEIGSIRITCCVRDGLFRCRRAAVSVGDGVAAFSGEQQEDMMIQRGSWAGTEQQRGTRRMLGKSAGVCIQ